MTASQSEPLPAWTIFLIFLRLGLTSFGGPIAHLGYFRHEFVVQRRWLSEERYAELLALCQFLPGPASSQVGMALGLSRGGHAGALAAWLGFTAPSAVLLIVFAWLLTGWAESVPSGALQGLMLVAVAVVAQAFWGMARSLSPDAPRATIMAVSAGVMLLFPSAWTQVLVIAVAGMVSLRLFAKDLASDAPLADPPATRARAGWPWLLAFAVLLVLLPLLVAFNDSQALAVLDAFYRAGALVFGGGHVVLPLLQAEVVPSGWVSEEVFLAGYAAAQAVPGPLFTFAAFLGASMSSPPTGVWGGLLALVAVFLPSYLLVAGALPVWEMLRRNQACQAALRGINAAVVGLLLAALYDLAVHHALTSPQAFFAVLLALVALVFWKWPPWLVVLVGGTAGWLLSAV